MRKIVVYELLSLDGVAEGPDDFITDYDDVMMRESPTRNRHPGYRTSRPSDL